MVEEECEGEEAGQDLVPTSPALGDMMLRKGQDWVPGPVLKL